MQLYLRAAAEKRPEGAGGNSAPKDVSKMKVTPAERRKELARQKAELQKEKVRYRHIGINENTAVVLLLSSHVSSCCTVRQVRRTGS